MHDYSMRGHPRERQIYYIALLAFSLMPLLTTLAGWVGVTKSVGTFSVFALLYVAFDKYGWRAKWVRKCLGFPDINGRWVCRGRQMNDQNETVQEWQADITIVQTWSRISVTLKTEHSTSLSGPASLCREDGHGFRLLYNYSNEPLPGEGQLRPHHGTCDLVFTDACDSATGVYFNDHNRLTFGRMTLTKQNNS